MWKQATIQKIRNGRARATRSLYFPIILAVVMANGTAFAQTASTGGIRGTVVDSTGAGMSGVTIEAVSSTTGTQRKGLSDAGGIYTIGLLPPGAYQLRYSAAGFETASPAPVTVSVTQTLTVNITMTVGAQQQEVQVSATVDPLIQTESAALGTTVGGETIQIVPLTERNYTQVLSMSPGVASDVNNAASLGKGTQDFYVNGTGNTSNNFHMDGTDINNYGSSRAGDFVQQAGIAIPNPDTIQEFRIQTTLYDAGFGRDAGANVEVVTKSGTNQLHGGLFEFFRNTVLDANDTFLKGAGQARPIMQQNQFGGVFGGPVLKNKLFFFGSYQGTRQVNGLSPSSFASNTLPALSNDRSAAAVGRAICGQATAFGGVSVACDGSNINPVALNLLNVKIANGTYLIPTPQTLRRGSNGLPIGFSAYSIPAHFKEDQYLVNTDYMISDKHRLEQRYFHAGDPQYQPFSTCSCTPGSGLNLNFSNDVATLRLTSSITPTFVNEATVSFVRSTGVLVSDARITDQSLGITPGNPNYPLMPIITITGLFTLGGTGNDNSFSVVNTYQGSDQISFTRGRNAFRAGYEFHVQQFNFDDPNQLRGALSFQTFPDFLLGQSAAQNGSSFSNVFTSTAAQGTYYKGYRAREMASFFQDDFKANSRLTFNLGVRWEINTGVSERYGNMSGLLPSLILNSPAPTAAGSFAGFVVPANYSHPLPDGVTRLGNNTLAENATPLHNFAPRLGFAWQPLAKSHAFVVRGGYGVFYSLTNGNSILQTLGGQPTVSRLSLTGASNSAATFQVPYTVPLTPGVWTPRTPTSQLSETLVAANYDSPMTQQFSLDVQGEVLPGTALELAYVGTRSTRLSESRALNAARLASPENPINGITVNTLANVPQRVPFLGFAPNGTTSIETYGFSMFHSLQATLKRRLSHGVQFQAAYTWSKVMTSVQGTGQNAVFVGGNGNSNDPNDRSQRWSPSGFDRTHRVVLVYLWKIPNPRGGGSLVQQALRDWSVSGTATIQSGLPLTITDSRGGSIYGFASTSRAQLCPGITHGDISTQGSVGSRVNSYFNNAAFCSVPVIGNGTGYGNSGAAIVRGPSQNNFDVSITRAFAVAERHSFEFRSEFFNALNHVQYSNPGVAFGTASFGVIGSTSVAARLIQFGLKYNF
jgi:hypothetical protein